MEDEKAIVKIKFDLGYGEIVNCYAKVVKSGEYYQLYFSDGYSFSLACKFDSKRRVFYDT